MQYFKRPESRLETKGETTTEYLRQVREQIARLTAKLNGDEGKGSPGETGFKLKR